MDDYHHNVFAGMLQVEEAVWSAEPHPQWICASCSWTVRPTGVLSLMGFKMILSECFMITGSVQQGGNDWVLDNRCIFTHSRNHKCQILCGKLLLLVFGRLNDLSQACLQTRAFSREHTVVSNHVLWLGLEVICNSPEEAIVTVALPTSGNTS